MFSTRRVMKCLVLRPGQRKAEEWCCVMSKAAEGGRGKRVLAAAAEDGIALFLEGFRFRLSLRVLVETVSDLGFKKSAFIAMAELDEIRLLLGQQSNAFQAQMTTLQADLPSTKGLIQAGCYGGEWLSKGLCFNCDNQWVCGHKCPGKFMTDEEGDMEPVTEEIQDDALEGGDISILNSLVGHVSLLKPFSGTGAEQVANFPEDEQEGQHLEQPLAICDTRIVLQKDTPVRQMLVQWSGRPPKKATWEWLLEFKIAYPSYHLEDMVIFEGGGNDMPRPEPMVEPRPKRVTSKPV
ncbi:hypothetical protein Tco_0438452 [Tanacetum coccineum]